MRLALPGHEAGIWFRCHNGVNRALLLLLYDANRFARGQPGGSNPGPFDRETTTNYWKKKKKKKK